MSAPITALVLTKNEAAAIQRCLSSLHFCDQVIVVDSNSTDGTRELALSAGAEVLDFAWDGKYPKKKQWGMEHTAVRNDWVLHIDADEIVPSDLAKEIGHKISEADTGSIRAFDIPLEYHFAGRALRHGHVVVKKSLLNRLHCHFPEVGDLEAPGITEVEGHYQPEVSGRSERLTARLIHDDPDPLESWISRHNRYSDWEAYLRTNSKTKGSVRANRSPQGRLFDAVPYKPLIFFVYSYFLRGGFLDGRAGFDYAFGLSWYYWLIGVKVREIRSDSTGAVNVPGS